MLKVPQQESNLLRCSSTHFHSTIRLVLDLMGWAFWRVWPGQKASSNFLTTRRSALFTTERNARLRSTWNKFRGSANVYHGLLELIWTNIRWKGCLKMVTYFQEFTFCGPEKESCVGNQTLRDQSCLIPCTGLHADVSDNSVQMTPFDQNVMKGRILMS